jgi:hypothetical protein
MTFRTRFALATTDVPLAYTSVGRQPDRRETDCRAIEQGLFRHHWWRCADDKSLIYTQLWALFTASSRAPSATCSANWQTFCLLRENYDEGITFTVRDRLVISLPFELRIYLRLSSTKSLPESGLETGQRGILSNKSFCFSNLNTRTSARLSAGTLLKFFAA